MSLSVHAYLYSVNFCRTAAEVVCNFSLVADIFCGGFFFPVELCVVNKPMKTGQCTLWIIQDDVVYIPGKDKVDVLKASKHYLY